MKKSKNRKMREKGVSLIEMLTAVAVFAITVGAISGIFISAVRSQRRILATQELLDQTSYVLEYMGRALRMAKKDSSGTCTGTPGKNYENFVGDSIAFLKSEYDPGTGGYIDVCYYFYLFSNRIYVSKNSAPGVPITSDKISVNFLKFNLYGDTVGESPNYQPRVTIFLEVEGREAAGSRPKIQIQTSISQRPLDK
jgi:prepilin-type N-terminal cleavage/methylation domain-containing protein